MSETPPPVAAVLLAAGKGTRMDSDLPKVLHEVAGKPMVRWVIDACRAAGVTRVVVVVGYREDLVREALQDEPNVAFATQSEQLGTGHAAAMAEEALADFTGDVFVLCGDMPLIRPHILDELLATHRTRSAAATLATAVLQDPTGYGRVIRETPSGGGDGGGFDRIVEQKDATPEQLAVREVNPSYYCFKAPELFDALKRVSSDNAQGEYYLTDVPGLLKQDGKPVALLDAVPESDVLGINTLDDLKTVDTVMRQRLAESPNPQEAV
ncbi:MAG: NTP transferase domain-containing protein [Planctomycetota bacterium]